MLAYIFTIAFNKFILVFVLTYESIRSQYRAVS